MNDYITVKEAARMLGISTSRVRVLVGSRRQTKRDDALPPLEGKKFGRDWQVTRRSVEARAQVKL